MLSQVLNVFFFSSLLFAGSTAVPVKASSWLVRETPQAIYLNKAGWEKFAQEEGTRKKLGKTRLKPAMGGIEIEEVPAGEPFSKLGVRPGDLLKTLNGTDLDLTLLLDPQRNRGLIEAWKNKQKFVLQLERNKKDVRLTYLVQ